MKTKVFYLATKVTVAAILVTLIALKANAGDAPKLKFVSTTTDRAIIAFDNNSNESAVLTIENANGDMLYYKEGNIDSKIYSKVFSFKNLSDGTYKATVKNDEGETSLNFNVNEDKINVLEKAESISPFFEVNKNALKLSFLNHSLSNVEVKFSGTEGEIYSKNLGKDFNIIAGFDITNLKEGNYVVNVSNGDNTYSYNFKK